MLLPSKQKHKWTQIECKMDDNKEAEDHNYFDQLDCAIRERSCRHRRRQYHNQPHSAATFSSRIKFESLRIETESRTINVADDLSDQNFNLEATISEGLKKMNKNTKKRANWSSGGTCTKIITMGFKQPQRHNRLQVPLLLCLASIFLILIIAQQAATTTTTTTIKPTITTTTTTTLDGQNVSRMHVEEMNGPSLVDGLQHQNRQRNNHKRHNHYQDNKVNKPTGKFGARERNIESNMDR